MNETQEKKREPYTFMERDLSKSAHAAFKDAPFGMTDDLIALGMTDDQIGEMVRMAVDLGIDITPEDVKKYRTIQNLTRAKDSICAWAGEYDPQKPLLVLAYGVARLKFFAPVMDDLKKRFSILIIEPIVEHWHLIFKKDRIEDVLDLYEDLIRYMIPEGAKIYAFMGYSFGGDIAYRLAVRWAVKDRCMSYVYLLDTYDRVYDGDRFEDYKKEVLDSLSGKDRLQAQIFWKMGYYCMDIPKKLGDGRPLPSYDGPVRLFSATQVKEEPTLAKVLPIKAIMREDNPNVIAWKQLAPHLVVDYIDADHITIMQAPEFHDIFLNRIDTDLRQ